MKTLALLLLIYAISAAAAQAPAKPKLTAQQLIALANANDAALRESILATFDEKEL